MRVRTVFIGVIALLMLVNSCRGLFFAELPAEENSLVLDAALHMEADGEISLRVGARNAGTEAFPGDRTFLGVLDVVDAAGNVYSRSELLSMPAIQPGDASYPIKVETSLAAGTYSLYWTSLSEEYGALTTTLNVLEVGDELTLQAHSSLIDVLTANTAVNDDLPLEIATAGDTLPSRRARLVDMARADLARRQRVEAEAIAVKSVRISGAGDSLFTIVLRLRGESYTYQGRDEQVLLVSDPLPGTATVQSRTPSVSIAPRSGPPGTEVAVVATSFPANTIVQVGVGRQRMELAATTNIVTNRAGAVTTTVTLPESARPSEFWVVTVRVPEMNGPMATSGAFTVVEPLATIRELTTRPEDYAGQHVCLQGVYAESVAMRVLGETSYLQGGSMHLSSPAIWIVGLDVSDLSSCVTREESGAPHTFCPVQVCGRFEHGGGYGPLGTYDYQLVIGDAQNVQ